jgi:hypothetical protein
MRNLSLAGRNNAKIELTESSRIVSPGTDPHRANA